MSGHPCLDDLTAETVQKAVFDLIRPDVAAVKRDEPDEKGAYAKP